MKKGFYVVLAVASAMVVGCGGSPKAKDSSKVWHLKKQKSGSKYLFYGDVNPKSLGALSNLTIIDSKANVTSNKDINTSSVRYPVVNTTFDYNANDNSYKNLKNSSVMYIKDNKAYKIDLTTNQISQVSTAQNLTRASFTKVNYLGVKNYIVANNKLITPNMSSSDDPIDFNNKKLLSVTYQSYGSKIDGYLVYDNNTSKVQKCTLDMSCSDILSAGSRSFEGDVLGTTYSIFLDNGKLYKVDKSNGHVTAISLGGKSIKRGHGTASLKGRDFYCISTDNKLYRVDLKNNQIVAITPKSDERIERIRGVIDDWIIYGSDTILLAAKKDGSTQNPILLAETTKTKGYKYVTNFGFKNRYLFERYTLDVKSGNVKYRACLFDNGDIKCKNNSFWAAIVSKTDGKLDFDANFQYTPYAVVRVDNTDSFGGGELKAIDPNHLLEDGITMGSVANYNFQTFISNYRYFTQIIDSDGGIVLFAKNDTNFHVDAFYMNLLKPNSLKQLNNFEPGEDIHKGRDHCHGRVCMICHSFAGGKIYKDLNGTRSAYGYRVKLKFEDGSSLLANISKGKGENFSLPIKSIKGNFKAQVLDANGSVVNSSAGYYHKGREYSNCNYCHGRYGKTRFDAPGAITIKR